MISTNEFKTGVTVEYEGDIYIVMEFLHQKTARSAANVKTKLRNLRTGAIVEKTFRGGEKLKKAQIDKTEMVYLYAEGDRHIFMNNETYEQIEIPGTQIEMELRFMVENTNVMVTFFQNEILGVALPDKMVLEITECDPGVKGDTKTNATKDAILETGHKIQVPLFIEKGERVIISTETGKYVSREKQ